MAEMTPLRRRMIEDMPAAGRVGRLCQATLRRPCSGAGLSRPLSRRRSRARMTPRCFPTSATRNLSKRSSAGSWQKE